MEASGLIVESWGRCAAGKKSVVTLRPFAFLLLLFALSLRPFAFLLFMFALPLQPFVVSWR